MESFPV